MSTHPQFVGTEEARLVCCDGGPAHPVPNGTIQFACTRRRRHLGKHVATLPGGVVIDEWPKGRRMPDLNGRIEWRNPLTWATIAWVSGFVALCVWAVAR